MTSLSASIIETINRNINGRLALEEYSIQCLVDAIEKSGEGDHLEIGALFGGSAIAAALAKSKLGYSGTVYSIDPFDGYYNGTVWCPKSKKDPISNVFPSLEIAQRNASACGVHVTFVKAYSLPFPENLEGKEFVTALIDGNHWNGYPLKDWLAIKDRVAKRVLFDDHDNKHQSVKEACATASKDSEWEEELGTGKIYIVRRKQ